MTYTCRFDPIKKHSKAKSKFLVQILTSHGPYIRSSGLCSHHRKPEQQGCPGKYFTPFRGTRNLGTLPDSPDFTVSIAILYD
jgi:hypothetical protein